MSGESGQDKSETGRKDESGAKLGGSKRTQCSDCRGLGAAAILFDLLARVICLAALRLSPDSCFLHSALDTVRLIAEEWGEMFMRNLHGMAA
jgi:hypothetical protein